MASTEKMIKFRAFKDDGKYKDDIFVCVKDKAYQIKRGVDVMIPEYVYDVLMENQKQSQAACDLMERKADEFASDDKKYG